MAKPSLRKTFVPVEGAKKHKATPHEFVLDAIAHLIPTTRPMFGCVAVYVGEKIMLILRDKAKPPEDDGVWLATTAAHHESLKRDFPSMRSIQVFGTALTSWQVLPSDSSDFEAAALLACELIAARDPRIGKVPKRRSKVKSPRRPSSRS
jgi:hypothetical protein